MQSIAGIPAHMTQGRACPKCHYDRHQVDHAPAWQCPRCGIVYDKFAGDRPAQGRLGDAPRVGKPWVRRFKTLRIALLTLILIMVGANTWITKIRATSWHHPLHVVIYPINADGSAAAANYIAGLDATRFDSIEQLMKQQAKRYGVAVDDPITIALASPIAELPPPQPRGDNILAIIWWSLKLRVWANRMDRSLGPAPEVRAFTLYYDPKTHPMLEHSTGLEKGMIGVIKLFAAASMNETNNVVMLHELLHTLGATDKYDLRTDQPIYPDGYAEPDLQPLLPQRKAEIMAGRIPLSRIRAEIPNTLADVVVGADTAREIGWAR